MLITKIRNKKLNDRYGSSSSNNIDMDNSFHPFGFNLTQKSLPKIKKYSFETVLNNSLPRSIDDNKSLNGFNSDLSLPYLNQSSIYDQKSRLNLNCQSPLLTTRSLKRDQSLKSDQRTLNDSSQFISNSNENILKSKFPMKPSGKTLFDFILNKKKKEILEALFYYSSKLTEYEKMEILNYSQIYFLGLEAEKISSLNLKDYDDEFGYYKKIFKDQILYRYEILETLGRGSFGLVIKCFDHKLNQFIALKIIKNKKRFEKQGLVEINILNYLKSLDQMNSFNIVHIKEYFYFRSHLCITFELLGINLYQLIKKNNYQGFSIDLVKRFAKSLLQSLKILSQENIIHCDLKPENVLLKQKGSSQIKLIDFGSGCFQSQRIYTYIQSRYYRAPEVILGIPYTTAIDIWSFACIIVELFTGYPIFPGENEEEQISMIMEVIDLPPIHILEQGTRTKLFFDSKGRPRYSKKNCKTRRPATKSLGEILRTNDQDFIDFIRQCLQWDPLLRLTPQQALDHSWILQKKLNRNSKTKSNQNISLTINEPSLDEQI